MQEESTTYVLRLYRKECAAPTKKPTKATLAKADNELALSRVRRSDLESFLRSGAFHKLTPLPAHVIKNAALRRRDHRSSEFCYVITVTDIGRAKTNAGTVSMSIRIWMTRYYADTGVIDPAEFAIVIDEE
jgi:hypothetical protein